MTMRKPRVLFVQSLNLGWKTYAAQLRESASERDDFEPVFRSVGPGPLPLRLMTRRRSKIYARYRAFRFIDPLTSKRLELAAWWRRFQARTPVDAIHVAGHDMGVAFASPGGPPLSLSADITRAAADRAFDDEEWTEADQARERALFVRAARIFAMSGWISRSLVEDYGVDAERIDVVPVSGEPSRYHVKTHGPVAKPRILFVGGDFERKGGDNLLRWHQAHLADRAELHIVSGGAGRLGGRNVVVHGAVPNQRVVDELMPSVDVFCLPTLADMTPNVLMEAAMSGLPVVCNDVGGCRELVNDGETGYLLSPHDHDGFVERLGRLLADPELRARMGAAARQNAVTRMSATTNFNRMFDRILETVHAQPKRDAAA